MSSINPFLNNNTNFGGNTFLNFNTNTQNSFTPTLSNPITNPFTLNNNPINTNNNNNNNNNSNSIFSRVNANIINGSNNINNSNNLQTNPFNSSNNVFNNLYSNQNVKTYNFKGISVSLPTSDTVGKVPPNAFGNNNYRIVKE
mgnify:CR=1 FL=1